MFERVKLFRPDLAIDPINDGRHDLGDRPHGRESIPYLVNLPDEGLRAGVGSLGLRVLMGLVLGYLVARTGSLLPGVLMHTAADIDVFG